VTGPGGQFPCRLVPSEDADVSTSITPATSEADAAEIRVGRATGAIAGLLAVGAGLACAELAAGVFGLATTPVLAVGGTFIDVIPTGVREFGIQLLGTADKPVLVAGIIAVLAGLAAVAGSTATRSRPLGFGILLVLTLVGVAAALARPDAGPLAVVPGFLAGAVAAAVLAWLLAAAASAPTRAVGPAGTGATALGRRRLLTAGGVVVVGSLVAAGVGRGLTAAASRKLAAENARTSLRLPDLPAARTPAGADLRIAGLGPWRTPNNVFYRIDTALSVPVIEPTDWRLRIHGMVDRPLELSFGDLLKRTIVHEYVTLTCVSNEVGGDLAGNAFWSGVRVADVLAEVGVDPRADAVKSTSQDGWTCGTPLSVLTDDRPALLAFAMNGTPLPLDHGFPVRMVVPGLYGYVSATKWLVDLEVTRFDQFRAYWTDRGWAEQGPIKTASRIDVPRPGADVPAGQVAVAGVAWAQHRGITQVEVRVDDGPWQRARLAAEPTNDSWRQWVWTWNATTGRHRLQVRATDSTGETQTSALAPPAPDGATGWHTVEIEVS
jgi:DMSO/TMAO reductase YedYZ molybdopterin-dependent catalytic subunit